MLTNENCSCICSPLMSISDAAKFLGVSRKTVYRLIEIEEIRAAKSGRSIWVDKMSLEAFRKSGKMT